MTYKIETWLCYWNWIWSKQDFTGFRFWACNSVTEQAWPLGRQMRSIQFIGFRSYSAPDYQPPQCWHSPIHIYVMFDFLPPQMAPWQTPRNSVMNATLKWRKWQISLQLRVYCYHHHQTICTHKSDFSVNLITSNHNETFIQAFLQITQIPSVLYSTNSQSTWLQCPDGCRGFSFLYC